MTETKLATLGLLLLVASIVAIVTRRLKLPYSVGLVAAGALLALQPRLPSFPLTRDLIFTVFLPPLIFEAALQLGWREFSRELPLTLTMAFPGVALAAAAIGAAMHWGAGWGWMGAALFGMLIAATDPVSVIAAFKEMRCDPRLSMVVESESLLNDAAAAIGFAVLATVAAGGAASAVSVALGLLWTILCSVGAGLLVAAGALLLAGRTSDPLVEITLTVIAAYGSFLLAEHFHGSGVLATLAAGLLVGNRGWMRALAGENQSLVLGFWEFAAFLVNSLIFMLIGTELARSPLHYGALAGILGIGAMLLARALTVYPLAALFCRSHLALPWAHQHVLFWGGLRGALALALALAVPEGVAERGAITQAAFDVVAFSIVVQGLTMGPLMRQLGLWGSGKK